MIELATGMTLDQPVRVAVYTRYPEDEASPRGGVEAVAATLVPALVRRPMLSVEVITLERDRKKRRIDVHAGFRVHRLPGTHWPQVADVVMGPGRSRLRRYVQQLGVDVVHSHETYGLGLGDMGIPHVLTVHGFDTHNIPASQGRWMHVRSSLWRRVERHGLADQQDIISISPYVRRLIEPLTDATIYDVENPVADRFYTLLRRASDLPRVLCVGWLSERKNALGALAMFREACRLGAPGELRFAGVADDPAYAARLHQAIVAQSPHRTTCLGQLDHTRLAEELSRASVLLLPSRQENAPMAVCEAMAAGVPVVASNLCGMPYLVADGESGYLVEPDDIRGGGERLAMLLRNPSMAAAMGGQGRRIAQRFRADAIALRTEAIYRRMVSLARVEVA